MEQSEQNGGKSCKPLPQEIQTQLDFLNQAEYYLNFILAGIFLRYRLFHNQRAMLLEQAYCPQTFDKCRYPDSFQTEVAASLLVLYALFGFHGQAQQIDYLMKQSGQGEQGSQEVFLTALVIVITLLRLRAVLQKGTAASDATEEQELLDIPDTA